MILKYLYIFDMFIFYWKDYFKYHICKKTLNKKKTQKSYVTKCIYATLIIFNNLFIQYLDSV